MNDLKQLLVAAKHVPPGCAMRMLQSAETDEERRFWAFVADMNLQRSQKETIKKNLF